MAIDRDELESEALEASGATYSGLVRAAWRRKSLIALGTVVGLILGALYYAQRTPVYQSSAQLLVVKKRPDALPFQGVGVPLSYFEDYLATHLVLIKSPLIVERAVKKVGGLALKSLAGQDDSAGAIIGALTVTRDAKDQMGRFSSILNLSYRGPLAEECGLVLDAVIASYEEFLEETYQNVSGETVKLITQARDVLQKDLSEKTATYQEFRQRAPLLWKGKEGLNQYQEALTTIQAARSALLVREAETRGRLTALESALKEGKGRESLAAVLARPLGKPAVESASPPTTADNSLEALQIKEKLLLEDFGPDHPQIRALRTQIELTREFLARSTARTGAGLKEKNPLLTDLVELQLLALRQDLREIEVLKQSLQELFESQRDEAKKLTNFEIEDETRRGEIERTKALYDSIIKRLQEVNLVKDLGGGYDAQIVSRPSAGAKVEPRLTQILLVATLLGFMGGCGLGYLAEVSDKSFRSPEEIRQRLGLPVVGHIPLLTANGTPPSDDPATAVLDPILVTVHRPKSVEAEAYRGVRTALYFSTRGEGHKVIQITSPNVADGKTTLAANLAASIAQSRKKVLLIDADFRRPRQHQLFALSSEHGLSTIMTGEDTLAEAVQPSGVAGLAVLPGGPPPPNPAELLTLPGFGALLDQARQQYDFVIIDTPPLLAVTDPCAVTPRVDGVLLVLRLSSRGRPEAQRARELLAALGANVLGVVVNGLDPKAGFGRYGGSDYGYGYGPMT